jgi:ABC-type dipeptide/oligopeptide/nickel transport system permease component
MSQSRSKPIAVFLDFPSKDYSKERSIHLLGATGLVGVWKEAAIVVLRKVVSLFLVLLLVLTIEFLFLRVGVGEAGYVQKGAYYPPTMSLQKDLHFDKPLVIQYFLFIGDMLTGHGSFGAFSQSSHSIVGDVIENSMPWTLVLFETSIVLSLLLGFLIAFLMHRTRRVRVRSVISLLAMLVWAVPVVLVAIFFYAQVVARFGLDWAYHLPLDYGAMDWGARTTAMLQLLSLPIVILVISTFGGFFLIASWGVRRVEGVPGDVNPQDGPKARSFVDGIVYMMPCLRLNIALTMSLVVLVEVFWNLGGLGRRVVMAALNLDLVFVEASSIVIVLIVLLTGFGVDVVSSLLAIRARRIRQVAIQPLAQTEVPDSPPRGGSRMSWRGAPKELKWFMSEYRRSALGVIGGVLVVAMAILAIAGPMLGKPYHFQFGATEGSSPVNQFLLGARDPFVQMLAVLILSTVIGFGLSLLVLPLGRLNYVFALVADSFLVFPVVIVIFLTAFQIGGFTQIFSRLVLSVVLVTWAPVALVVVRRTRDINTAFRMERPTAKGVARYKGVVLSGAWRSLPDVLASLKFIAVVGTASILAYNKVFTFGMDHSSWSGMIDHALQYSEFHKLSFWWVLPLVGFVLLISGFYLVLDASQDVLERRIRLQDTSDLSPPASP